jgi:peptidyl-dipeptidase Dcp
MNNIYKVLAISGLVSLSLFSCKREPALDKSNPFFSAYNTPFEVPPFEKIMAKHYIPAFEKGMADGRKEIEILSKSKSTPTFENTIEAFDKTGELLNKVSSVFFSQASANTNDSLKKIEMDISPVLSGYRDEILLNPDLFRKVKYIYDERAKLNLTDEQKFLLENLYKGFVRNGANLNKQDQDTLKVLNKKLSVLTVKFRDK